MSHISDGQSKQVVGALTAAGWTPPDFTLLGQAGRDRLIGIRDSLRRGGDIVQAVIDGQTENWLHPEQEKGWVPGRKILTHLTDTGLFASCADLDELKAVQAKGIEFFRQHWRGKALFGWRGVQVDSVPYLIESDDKVVLNWYRLGFSWDADYPGLRRK